MIREAVSAEAQTLTDLINLAFQVEKFFIDTERITVQQVRQFFESGVFLVEEAEGGIAACVYLELRGERAYFGLLSVDPARQRHGIGCRLIAAAEAFARARGCRFMDMQIVNLRAELPGYYRRQGYVETGSGPFPNDVETKLPCHFVQMSKPLTA